MSEAQQIQSIEQSLRSLSIEGRARVAHAAVTSLEGLDPSAIKNLWLDEAERRDLELESGAVRAIPGEEVKENIRKRFGF